MKKIAVLGLGLIGGSFALALKQADLTEQIAGYDINPNATCRAKERGAITHICATPEEATQQADMVVLATPVLAMRELLERIAPVLSPGTLVTDTASTKAQVLIWARALLPTSVVFVGGHPMTGKEHSGIEAAEAGLFAGCVYCLTPTAETSQETLAQMRVVVTRLGARPRILAAEQHDRLVAGISHLPFVLSTALVQMLGAEDGWLDMARLAAGGYRDMSRLAGGSPTMYRDICLTNREAILGWLDALTLQLESVRELIATSDGALELYFARAKQVRDTWPLLGTTGISREGSTREEISSNSTALVSNDGFTETTRVPRLV